MDKTMVRKEMLRLRGALPEQFVTETGKLIGAYAASLETFQKAETVMLYSSFRNEVETTHLLNYCLKKGKKTVLPLTDENFQLQPYYVENRDQLLLSPMGIWEPNQAVCTPCPPHGVDLVLAPGVAFDISGLRIGFGKGCYDQFLPTLRSGVPVIGLAYDFQVLPQIPGTAQDFPMDAILSEKGLLPAARARVDVI